MARAPKPPKSIDALKHDAASRRNIPTAEMESFFLREEDRAHRPPKAYPRERPLAKGETRERAEELDPQLIWNGAKIRITKAQMEQLAETGELELGDAQLVWRGKDTQDWSDLIVNVPPLYIQEKIHPKAIIDDLKRQAAKKREAESDAPDLFADFNGIEPDQRAEFYQHDQHWSNRMILGDSLQVMASLAERENLRGKVQCIYFDPPYGVNFGSNWQVSTTSQKVQDGKIDQVTREPEQVKAFRDTWKDGIHSYLSYLRDRLTVSRDLLSDTGSVFVQIGDENVHRVRVLLDEIFGENNFFSQITLRKLSPLGTSGMANITDHILWYAKDKKQVKFRPIYDEKGAGGESRYTYVQLPNGQRRALSKEERDNVDALENSWKVFTPSTIISSGFTPTCTYSFEFHGRTLAAQKRSWRTNRRGMETLIKADRIVVHGTLPYMVAFHQDNPLKTMDNIWLDSGSASTSYEKIYVVQTSTRQVQKCILMASDPGDLVLDPTCGSGTTAYVAEQWGRRWITIDTSRVALALARTRIMSARFPWYLLADSKDGRAKEAALTQQVPLDTPVHHDIRQGFVYERVPHITLKSIANNPLIDDIWEKWQAVLEPLRAALNSTCGEAWEEWQIPRELPGAAPASAKEPHAKWWEARIARQQEIDASIAARADVEYLYNKPYDDPSRVRVAGPFTVESLSPHRVLPTQRGGVDRRDRCRRGQARKG